MSNNRTNRRHDSIEKSRSRSANFSVYRSWYERRTGQYSLSIPDNAVVITLADDNSDEVLQMTRESFAKPSQVIAVNGEVAKCKRIASTGVTALYSWFGSAVELLADVGIPAFSAINFDSMETWFGKLSSATADPTVLSRLQKEFLQVALVTPVDCMLKFNVALNVAQGKTRAYSSSGTLARDGNCECIEVVKIQKDIKRVLSTRKLGYKFEFVCKPQTYIAGVTVMATFYLVRTR
jgi:hypothetical protein